MSLFDVNHVLKPESEDFIKSTGLMQDYIAGSLKQFKKSLEHLEHNTYYHYSTGGQWSTHELLQYLFTITGPADLYISTWAMTEEPVRALIDLKNKKLIRSIHCLFDYKIKEQKSKAFLLAESNFDSITLAKCHAKVSVIRNETWGLTVFGSANHTRNPRIERGCICTDPKAADFDINWIKQCMAHEPIFRVR